LLEKTAQREEGASRGGASRVVDARVGGARRREGSGGVGGARPTLGVGPDSRYHVENRNVETPRTLGGGG
jgi:hypothetical protein